MQIAPQATFDEKIYELNQKFRLKPSLMTI